MNVAEIGVRTRNFAFGLHGLTPPAEQFGVTLVSPSEDTWTWGPDDAAQTVTGSASTSACWSPSACTAATPTSQAVGPDADRWLDIAQAFAGPPGEGRGQA